jgi:hypothetical protein
MIKHLFVIKILFFLAGNVIAQTYGNEWINFSQVYYKISVPKTGLYKIDYATLVNSGVPITSINPKNFQLFIRGQEQYITVSGESDNVFNSTDYIEFFAKKNDGLIDSLAYTDINRLPNPYVPLFNDTTYAYLTWNNLFTNKRFAIESDVNFTGYTPANYFYSEKVEAYKSSYSLGNVIAGSISDPRYVTGEGYGESIGKGGSKQTSFGNLNVYQSALPVYIKTSYSGTSENGNWGINYDHQIQLDFFDNNGVYQTIHDTTFYGFKQVNIAKQITANQLQNTSLIRLSSVNNPLFTSTNNSTNLHYLYLKYPQKTDFLNTSEQTFFVDDDLTSPKTFLDIQNVTVGSNQVKLFDLTNHKYISTTVSGSNVKALVPNASKQKECFLTTSNNVNIVAKLSPVNQTGFFANYFTSNSDSAFVIITHKTLESSANLYKQYRQSAAGGSNRVIMADINDLYDQFAYGNVKNPMAIKNFCGYLSDKLSVPPKYVLLIGKSIKHSLISGNSLNWVNCLVPTMGNPASDNLLTSGLHGSGSSTPFIPIGRISAKSDLEVTQYLNKVISHETGISSLQPDDWRKHVLHFSGGSDLSQQQTFESYLQTFANIIKDTLYGAEVFNFQKNTTAPIQITISDSVTQLINYGASLITFFGHGSVTGFDQAIDDPNAYNNKDKYPLFVANSCYSGDIHLPESNSASEKFTLINEKGSIAFIASSSLGLVNTLYNFTNYLYQGLGYQTYYKGIGDAVKRSASKGSMLNSQTQEITDLEMTLEGDPSIKLNAFKKADYAIKNSSVSFDTNTYTDSIGVSIKIANNGRALNDTFVVFSERYFPNGDSISFFKKIAAPINNSTVKFFILKDFINGVGLNRFKVTVDYFNEIDELSENNNSTVGFVDLFISGGDVIPVYPYKFAIVPKTNQITLKASTADPFALSVNYKLQLDTNDAFTNPINTAIINSNGGVINWTVNLPFADSTVYFWRISKDSVSTADRYSWKESSFQVIGSKTGWAQAHFNQFKNNGYQYVNYKRATRKFEFFNNLSSLQCKNGFSNAINYADLQYSINNSVRSNWHFAFNGWSIAVFDSVSIAPWTSRVTGSNQFTSYNNCLAFPFEDRASFDFGQTSYCGATPNWQADLLNFFNQIPVNNYVLAYSSDAHYATSYNNALYQAFETIGSANIRSVSDSVPMIIFGKKRSVPSPGVAKEVIGTSPSAVIYLEDSIPSKWDKGHIVSEIIGPTGKWNSLHWNYSNQNTSVNDSIIIKLVGLHKNGTIDTLATFNKDSLDVYDLENYVNASNYPYIKLVALLNDNVFHLAPQLKKWQVLYDEIPECAINPLNGYSNNTSLNAISEGDNLIVHLPIENIGQKTFTDSLVVTYWIEDASRIIHPLPQKLKTKLFAPSQIITDTINLNSLNFSGTNYLWVYVNPESNSKYQLEQYHFNNIIRIPFNVSKDNINPLLDVTFDGSHILNGDIVSSKPHILISLKDENKFLALNDTSSFNVFITTPNQPSEKRIYFSNALQFTPAQLPNNSCKIEWKPEFSEDGKHKLIVQAKDRSKNVSGAVDYNIQFEIINKQTVTEVMNYPNPFSTSTRFVFTLTGNEIPDVFTIQIMTITGKIVKEITKNELGNIHIGRNITDYAWDGKDEFGDRLANGVYLYKVTIRQNGQTIEKNVTEADAFFKKGIGKMVIIR